jgi:hypothetical protein
MAQLSQLTRTKNYFFFSFQLLSLVTVIVIGLAERETEWPVVELLIAAMGFA